MISGVRIGVAILMYSASFGGERLATSSSSRSRRSSWVRSTPGVGCFLSSLISLSFLSSRSSFASSFVTSSGTGASVFLVFSNGLMLLNKPSIADSGLLAEREEASAFRRASSEPRRSSFEGGVAALASDISGINLRSELKAAEGS